MKNHVKSGICKENIFTNFFNKSAKSLQNYLYYKFGNQAQAEDITQEAFIKLWQNCANVPLEKAKSYLYTIANNASLNIIAHNKVVLNYEKSNVANESTLTESPEFILEEAEFRTKLLTAIENINETQRVAFLMHRIDGKKYTEIALELNIGVKAVEKRIHQALLEIRKEFKNFK